MRLDVITIFPEYLAPLELSLPGKAREKGPQDASPGDGTPIQVGAARP